jgi:hypothetical protein
MALKIGDICPKCEGGRIGRQPHYMSGFGGAAGTVSGEHLRFYCNCGFSIMAPCADTPKPKTRGKPKRK